MPLSPAKTFEVIHRYVNGRPYLIPVAKEDDTLDPAVAGRIWRDLKALNDPPFDREAFFGDVMALGEPGTANTLRTLMMGLAFPLCVAVPLLLATYAVVFFALARDLTGCWNIGTVRVLTQLISVTTQILLGLGVLALLRRWLFRRRTPLVPGDVARVFEVVGSVVFGSLLAAVTLQLHYCTDDFSGAAAVTGLAGLGVLTLLGLATLSIHYLFYATGALFDALAQRLTRSARNNRRATFVHKPPYLAEDMTGVADLDLIDWLKDP